MGKMSIKTAILVPTISVLIVGVAVMITIVANLSSTTANDLTKRLIGASVNEYANRFSEMNGLAYGNAVSLSATIQTVIKESNNPREDIIKYLSASLMQSSDIIGAWTCWEPDALDGKDYMFANTELHDATGRYIPYVYKVGSSYGVEALVDYDDSEYYGDAKKYGKPYVTDPFSYVVDGKETILYTITIPIIKGGVFQGAIGVDMSLDNVINTINKGSILNDGYLFTISPEGRFATHPNTELITQPISNTWLASYESQLKQISEKGGSFEVTTFSDQINADIMFYSIGTAIGDIERYWTVCGIIPMKTVNGSSYTLLKYIISVGIALIIIVGVTILIIVRNSLRDLPKLKETAEAIVSGNIDSVNLAANSDINTKNEIALLTNAFSNLQSVFKNLINDLNKMAKAHNEGDIEYFIDKKEYSGEYGHLVDSVNKMASNYINDTMESMKVFTNIVNGDFDADMQKLPGKKIIVNKTIDNLRTSILSVSGEVDAMIQSAVNGNIKERIQCEKYSGGWKSIMEGLNNVLLAVEKPVLEINDVMLKLSSGDFSDRVNGDYKGEFLQIKNRVNSTIDEISSYITNITEILSKVSSNDLTESITKEYVGQFVDIKNSINKIISELNKTITNISSAAEQVNRGSKDISHSSMTLATGSTEQASVIQQLNASIDTISEQTRVNAQNASEANDLSDNSKNNAAVGNDEMQNMLSAMEDIKKSSTNISNVIKVIDDIAFQTNLLALNAAVEAARAGENGKGFAVVAEEVRSLASRSQNAAKETAQLIEDSISKVNQGREMAHNTAKTFEIIVKNVTEVSDIITSIAEASQQQAESLSQITQGLSQITMVVQSNSATSEESAAAAQELSGQSDILNNLVLVFKLKK